MYIKDEYNVDQSHLIEMGIEFYIAGRTCYCRNFIGLYLILPILFHHAIEYLIKGYLSYDMDTEVLKKLSHNLSQLWLRFKEKNKDTGFDKYDSFIKQFDKAKRLRYPIGSNLDTIGENNPTYYPSGKIDDSELDSVGWSIEIIDEIIYLICQKMRAPLSAIDWVEHKFSKCEELFSNNNYFNRKR